MFKFLSRLGDSNEREVRALQPIVERITALEPEIQAGERLPVRRLEPQGG